MDQQFKSLNVGTHIAKMEILKGTLIKHIVMNMLLLRYINLQKIIFITATVVKIILTNAILYTT